MNNASRKTQNISDRYLSFMLKNEEYCLEILKVREIMGRVEITSLPQTPDFIRGVINLRGNIVPIVDLRLKFGLDYIEYSQRTTVIFVEILFENEQNLMGIVVDDIRDVVNVPKDKISKVPYINSKIKSHYIQGIAETEDGIKIVLDIDKVLSEDEFILLNEFTNEDSLN